MKVESSAKGGSYCGSISARLSLLGYVSRPSHEGDHVLTPALSIGSAGVAERLRAVALDVEGRPNPIDQVRRFMRHWICDRSFRDALLVDPQAAVAARGLMLEAEDLRIFWDPALRQSLEGLSPSALLKKLSRLALTWIELKLREEDYQKRVWSESDPENTQFSAWRKRQVARCDLTFRAGYAKATPHVLYAIELSKGCSVGCWFCGVDAPKLDGHFLYSTENAALFREVLEVLAKVVGRTAGKWGFLYWATDPFDNPDYELFCSDFAKQFGQFPATTTAKGWSDFSRTRKLIELSQAHGRAHVRLSILSLKMLDRYLSELAPKELAGVSFVPVNRESVVRTAQAGRARRRTPTNREEDDAPNIVGTSIACVSGFLLNLVDRSVRLISPCESNDRWPAGYFVYEERRFAGPEELRSVLEGMIERHMPLRLSADVPLRFNSDLRYTRAPVGFEVSHVGSKQFDSNSLMGDIGDLVSAGQRTVSELQAEVRARSGAAESYIVAALQEVFEAGVLNAEAS